MGDQLSTKAVTEQVKRATEVDWSYGWRYEEVQTPNGAVQTRRVPLTPEEALHPKEEYVMSERTSHTLIATELS